ncbi:DUF4153 domain-containing protein [Alteromonas sp. AMM-1]|uniref:DUF4153 domain-containing protein n=1 Tax=Alteromonas sp. AMM-1 TaxID=3394233 RepID=UPI0039A61B59
MDTSRYPTLLMLLVALVQGFCLLILHESIEFEFWPATSPSWLYTLYAFVLVCPTMFLLAANNANTLRLGTGAVGFALLCAALAYYTGLQVIPLPHADVEELLFPFCFAISLLTFKALMYLQVWADDEPLDYPKLFSYSWRNLLTLGLGLAFTLVTWGVLMLWAGLFKVINIDFFYDLFTEEWFYYPILTMALAFGIILIRSLTVIVDTIKRLQQVLLKYLLVLLIFVSLLFLVTLPFTGLEPIWENGPGSYLMLWMQACILFALNSVYQSNADERPYALPVHRFIYGGIALLPCYSALVFYGLALRIEQYGWSVSRFWGIIVWALLALFSIGYVLAIVRKRDAWIATLGKVNVGMGVVLMLTLVAVNSPLLDLRKRTVNDQLNRIADGKIAIDDIDIQYFERHLAKPGFDAIEKWKTTYRDTYPEFVMRLNQLYMNWDEINSENDKTLLMSNVKCIRDCAAPSELLEQIYIDLSANRWVMRDIKHLYLLQVDPNEDGETEYLLIQETVYGGTTFYLYAWQQQWQKLIVNSVNTKGDSPEGDILKLLENATVLYEAPKYKHMRIGDLIIGTHLDNNHSQTSKQAEEQ